ncbi:hypothetical protein PYW08_005842 [Mythimna loreyi]|uniref:Uncharacterized protein n=1 Tax=Mythimna loreyi TaxID=667449 RepID=A0ACC2QMU9_9NEOP|nr:hypothetical protein PYW08_005842 [Mythimna loreyi]
MPCHKMQRTPPSTPRSTLVAGQSLSESDLTSAATNQNIDGNNITVRYKRQRIDDSPNKEFDPELKPALDDFKLELLDMLTKWKTEHDQMLTSWKNDQDAVLAKLVSDVTQLKNQCLSIQTTNSEIERSMTFINNQYEEIISKVSSLEKEKNANSEHINRLQKQIQDLHFAKRPATIEIRNIPVKENENPDDLIAVALKVGKAVDMDIQASAFRDIYCIPGRPGLCRPIVAEFSCVNTRNDFLAKVRTFNKERQLHDKLNSQSVGIEGDKKPVYVDEHLPSTVKKLLYDARQFAKTHNYSSWYSNGRILLRKEPTDKPIHIKSEKCLSILLGQQ